MRKYRDSKDQKMNMLIPSLTLILSFAVLIWCADRFVFGASALAKNLGAPPILIGLTIVAMGSSAPEMLVSGNAALLNKTDTAVGNALGSNITNILLVLGCTALIRPLTISSDSLKREMPILMFITAIASVLLFDGELSRFDAGVLVFLFLLFTVYLYRLSRAGTPDPMTSELEEEIPSNVKTSTAVMWVIAGLILLPASSHFLVNSAVEIAKFFGMSDLVIGLTIIAIGTSLPELAASIAGALKGEDDMAIGNIIGSNIFNLLVVLAIGGMITPSPLDPAVNRDIGVMIAATIFMFVLSIGIRNKAKLTRFNGGLFLAGFIAYQAVILMSI